MRCPYCKFKFGDGKIGIRIYLIKNFTSVWYESDLKNTIKEPSEFRIYACDICGGFLTTDGGKLAMLDGTDDIFQVDENERIEVSAKLFEIIRNLNINRDDFIEGMLKDIFGEKDE